MDKKNLAIIGGGPGGYLAALRAAQLGLSVVLFEQEKVGGICIKCWLYSYQVSSPSDSYFLSNSG